MDCLRATMQWAGLFHFLWCFIIQVVLELINCMAVTNRDLTPYQLFYDELEPVTAPHQPNLKAYKAIGSHYEVLIPLEKRPKAYKVKARTESERLLAVLGSKTYLTYVPTKNMVTKTPFIKLYEPKNPLTLERVTKPTGIRPLNDVAVTEDSTGEGVSLDLPEIDDIGPPEPTAPEAPGPSRPPEPPAPGPSKPSEPLAPGPSRPPEPVPGPSRPSEKPIEPMDSSNLDEIQLDLVTSLCYRVKAKIFKKKLDKNSSTPNTYKQALKSPNVKEWIAATFSEFEQLISSETFKFLPYEALPKGRKPLTNRLVFKEKKDQYDVTIKFKARLVVRGFMQIEGVDYFETFAFTIISPSWRILLAIAAIYDWEVKQIDFVEAFLNTNLKEDIYMQIPESFKAFAAKILKEKPKIARLFKKLGYNLFEKQIILFAKALYGLKQSFREWQLKFKTFLGELGFKPLVSDSAVFYNPENGIFIVMFVDDCLFIGLKFSEINVVKRKIAKEYAIEDRGPAAYFLGVQIIRDRTKRALWLSQSHYIREVLKRFGLENSRPVLIPLQPGLLE